MVSLIVLGMTEEGITYSTGFDKKANEDKTANGMRDTARFYSVK